MSGEHEAPSPPLSTLGPTFARQEVWAGRLRVQQLPLVGLWTAFLSLPLERFVEVREMLTQAEPLRARVPEKDGGC